jgi:hypothetical protein
VGLVKRDAGDRLTLTPRGWELARKPETERAVFREVLDSVAPYRSALEWMHHGDFEEVTTPDVGAQWHEHHAAALGTTNENTIRENVVAFFRLAEAAGLGQLVQGGGPSRTPTRFKIDREALKSLIEAGPSAPPWTGGDESDTRDEPDEAAETAILPPPPADEEPPATVGVRRVFITHGKNMDIVEQVQTLLDVARIESEVAEEEETTAVPVPQKVFDAMRRCNAGIIVVSAEGSTEDGFRINENVLIEIGAAFLLYEQQVVLVWDKRLPVPSNLQGLYRCEYEGDQLDWPSGMKLMKAIQGFK